MSETLVRRISAAERILIGTVADKFKQFLQEFQRDGVFTYQDTLVCMLHRHHCDVQ